jgi:hypothetical protein
MRLLTHLQGKVQNASALPYLFVVCVKRGDNSDCRSIIIQILAGRFDKFGKAYLIYSLYFERRIGIELLSDLFTFKF